MSGVDQNEGMALIPRYESEKEISNKAPVCRHCGALEDLAPEIEKHP
jgi:hypothetical protein